MTKLLARIALAIVGAATSLGTSLSTKFGDIQEAVDGAVAVEGS